MLDKAKFLKEFNIDSNFEKSGISWTQLNDIYEHYTLELKPRLEKIKNEIIIKINEKIEEENKNRKEDEIIRIHSVSGRVKDEYHLIEKIIRKRSSENKAKYNNIDKNNYYKIITDLIGIRILTFFKEDWRKVNDIITTLVEDPKLNYSLADLGHEYNPVAYMRYGDRDIYQNRNIRKQYTNKGYRSQHYIVKINNEFCEIQSRTLTEEVYGEFDHYIRYPYNQDNNFLKRYTSVVAELLNSVDELLSTCYQFGNDGRCATNKYFEKDIYDNFDDNYIYDSNNQNQSYEETNDRVNANEFAMNMLKKI